MFGYTLQDWINLDVAPSSDLIQTEGDWMSFQPFQDIVFWVDVRGINNGDAGNVALRLETAPTKDESLFTPMVDITTLAAGINVYPVLLASFTGSAPLSRWVRWRLYHSGTASGVNYGATFRILCAANAVGGMRG